MSETELATTQHAAQESSQTATTTTVKSEGEPADATPLDAGVKANAESEPIVATPEAGLVDATTATIKEPVVLAEESLPPASNVESPAETTVSAEKSLLPSEPTVAVVPVAPEEIVPTTTEPVNTDPASMATPKEAESTAVTPEITAVPVEPESQDPQPAQSIPTPAEAPVVESQLNGQTAEVITEPQNKLTQKFTEAEWKALKEFRSQLPDIFAEAYPEASKARETPVTMWGVTLDPVNPLKDARISVVLMKFLRARHLRLPDARDMLVNTLRWREEFNLQAALDEDYPTEIFGNLGYIHGRDKEGRPVIYNIYGGNKDLKAVFGDVQRFIRWRVALMEKSVARLDFNETDQTIQIHDYAGVSLSSRDANSKAAAGEASNIFQSHYPELLYKKLFVNVPILLTWIFWAFKPLVSAETIAKMSVVGSGKSTIKKALLPYIEEKEIPSRYGGTAQAF